MTVPASAPYAGPYTADGVNRLWDFGFKITEATQINILVSDDAAGTNQVTVTTGFEFPDPADIGSDTGGTVRYPISPVAALVAGKVVRVVRVPVYEQPDAIGNQGSFFPEVIEGALDRLTFETQDLDARLKRAPLAPVGGSGQDLIDAIKSDVADDAADAVAAAATASAAAAIAVAARDATLAAYDSFDDRYLGAKAANPTLDNDGNALVAGALYFNTVSAAMMLYTGTIWVAAYVSGTGFLASANNLSDLLSAATARTNIGLGNVNNTSDATKFANTPLTGVPTAPTAAKGTNTTQLATTAFVEAIDAPFAITYAATIPVSHADSLTQTVTLTGNGAFGAPSNTRVGKTLDLVVTQDATGGRVPTWHANYDFGDYGTPAGSTGANQADLYSFKCLSATKYAFLGIRKRVD